MKLLALLGSMLGWACVGTVALEGGMAAKLWMQGKLDATKISRVAAVMYGVDPQSLDEELGDDRSTKEVELPSFEEISAARSLTSLDMDLREMAIDKAQISQQFFQLALDREKQQYSDTRQRFEDRRKEFEGAATDEGLLEVQQTLISLPPRDAKEEILLMLQDDPAGKNGRAMTELVAIIKSMPLEKRKKILGQFKSPDEEVQLGDVLENIRRGMPHVDLIQKTRQQLRQFQPRREKDDSNGTDTF